MKMSKNKLINIFKTGILLFGISLLLWNCQNQEDFIENNQGSEYIEKAKNLLEQQTKNKSLSEIVAISKSIDWTKSIFSEKNNEKYLEVFLDSKKEISLKSEDNLIINFHNRILFKFNESNNTEIYLTTIISSENNFDFISKKENINHSKISDKFNGSIVLENKNGICFRNNYKNGILITKTKDLYSRVSGRRECYRIVEVFDNGSFRVVGGSTFCLGYNTDGNYKGGYHGGGGNINKSGNNSNEDKIINELTGKADCVYEKMSDSKGNINWILKNFKDGHKPSQFDLKLIMSSSLDAKTNASTSKSGNTFTIKINANTLSDRTSLGLARTIIHEGVHARLREFASREGSNAISFPGVYDYFRVYKKNWDHQQMADFYRTTIANGLKQFDKGQHSGQFYRDMAWEGLANIVDANGIHDQIYTEAWKKLTLTEKNRIKNAITDEKENGNKTCQ